MSASSNPQIIIVGAGIAGLVLGRCLIHRGIIPTILEKSRCSPHRNNYGITLHSKSYNPLLRIIGLDEVAFRRRVAVDAEIGGTGRFGTNNEASFRANRNRFEGLLAEGLEVLWEREVERVGAKAVYLVNGEELKGEIVIGADGPHSVVRKAEAPGVEMRVLPFAVYNGKRRVSTKELQENDWDEANATEYRLGGSVFQISVNDIDGEEVSLSYTYSRPAKEGHDPLYRPERSKEAAKDIPEELFHEIDALRAQLPNLFQYIFHAEAMRKDRLLNWLMRSMQMDEAKLQAANMLLIGDAIHTEPILGPSYGANEAMEDSIALADFLADEKRRPLEEFNQNKIHDWKAAVRQSEIRIQDMHAKPSVSL